MRGKLAVVLLTLVGVGACTSSNPARDAATDRPSAVDHSQLTFEVGSRPGDSGLVDRQTAELSSKPDTLVGPDLSNPAACGNSKCEASLGETCKSCPKDCGACSVVCGDGTCDSTESCLVCPSDCGGCCGNGVCDTKLGESCQSCTKDCGDCCGDGGCEQVFGENCQNCAKDCGACQASCGNGQCEIALGESCGNCPSDCGKCCGDGKCDSKAGETCQSCPTDCGKCCGNGSCETQFAETCNSCAVDCGKCCGNGSCEAQFAETCNSCSADCGACCGNGKCELLYGETSKTCPKDCSGLTQTCQDLVKLYAQTLLAAKACSKMRPVLQCDTLVLDQIACGCPTHATSLHAQEILELTRLEQQYQVQQCQTTPCPLLPCTKPGLTACVGGLGGPGVCMDATP